MRFHYQILMKDNKRKTLIKAVRKAAQKNILETLTPELTKISATIGAGSAKLEKVIAKELNRLAKKIAKEIELDETAIVAKAEKPAKVAKPVKSAVKKIEKPVVVKTAGKKQTKVEVVTAS